MPPTLLTLAVWGACLIVLGVVIYFFWQIIGRVAIVALPVAVAFLLTALLYPVTGRLRRRMRPIYATWLTMLLFFAVIVGMGFLIGVRANAEYPRLVDQIEKTSREVQNWLINGPIHLKESQITGAMDELMKQLSEQRGQITGTVLTGATAVIEVLAGIVLLLFVTFFFLKDGDRIWAWFLRAFGGAAPRVDRAGRAAWRTLSHYVQGTVAVAAIHGVVIGATLAVLQVPLWAPLAVLVFMASFIPIVGILFAGTVATLVTFGSQGWLPAVIFVGVLIVEQQLENHVLQPLIVGRALEFHPLAIILVLGVGGVIAGIAGAAVAVPISAVIYRALPELRRNPPPVEPPPSTPPPEPPPPPASSPELEAVPADSSTPPSSGS
ncbi:AI-2E family transporter [Microtetraspora sp. NBRC 16547]|uniref:AI-2E family transporter n=1 Tax=Microtetraspora sp. NBRC 16547 TaxID=3030993 RepID=UPI0025537D84|nr:AI-2E family transporter [Microtetraspora sp. NBRC 16547]